MRGDGHAIEQRQYWITERANLCPAFLNSGLRQLDCSRKTLRPYMHHRLAWASVSDRVMPWRPANLAKGDHSTVAALQYLAFHTGAFVVGATRTGIEENPITEQKLYYNGGSSIWAPDGTRMAQTSVVPSEVLSPGVHGVITAEIDAAKSAPVRTALLQRRRPELYELLAIHRAPGGGRLSRPTRPNAWHVSSASSGRMI